MPGSLFTFEERKRFAPNAVSSMKDIRIGDVVYVLFCGTVQRARVEDILINMKGSPDVCRIFLDFFNGQPNHSDLSSSDIGITPYNLNHPNGKIWNGMNMVFHTLEDAISVGTNVNYVERQPREKLLRYLKGFMGEDVHGLNDYTRNPNLVSA